jgi:hypothetical protein
MLSGAVIFTTALPPLMTRLYVAPAVSAACIATVSSVTPSPTTPNMPTQRVRLALTYACSVSSTLPSVGVGTMPSAVSASAASAAACVAVTLALVAV